MKYEWKSVASPFASSVGCPFLIYTVCVSAAVSDRLISKNIFYILFKLWLSIQFCSFFIEVFYFFFWIFCSIFYMFPSLSTFDFIYYASLMILLLLFSFILYVIRFLWVLSLLLLLSSHTHFQCFDIVFLVLSSVLLIA